MARRWRGTVMLLAMFWPSLVVAGADFFVAPGGKDTNPGTTDEPLATVAKARDLVRQKIAAGLDHDLVVTIRGGIYPLTETLVFGPEDSGTEQHSITYAAAPGEKVVLSGGRTITGWKKAEGPIWTVELPEVKAGKWYFRQLFVDGRRAVRSRTPNAGEPWWKLQPKPENTDANDAPITLGVDHPIRAWKNVSDVEAIWMYNNDGTRKRLGSVNESDNTFTLPPPHAWPHGLPREYNISFPKDPYPCYFENALEMLDQPGEWYLDRQTGVLSYWPREGEDLTRAEVVAPAAENTLLAVRGQADRPVRNLHFRGIRAAYVDWPLPACGFAAQFGCLIVEESSDPPDSKKFRWMDAAVSFQHARDCSFADGAVEHGGGIGLAVLIGCTKIVVEGNDIHGLGGGGIVAGAIRNRDTYQWADPVREGDHHGHRIANNHVYDCGSDYFGAIGVFTGLMQDSVIAHNLIHDISYSGIVLDGNEAPDSPVVAKNNVCEDNHIHHVMQMAQDGAAIYVSFPQTDPGSVIRGNLIHDTGHRGEWNGQYCGGLYTDGISGRCGPCANYQFLNNVVYHSDAPLMVPARELEVLSWIDNLTYRGTAGLCSTQEDAPPAELLEALESRAGLEPACRHAILGIEAEQCERYPLTDETRDMAAWSVQQFHWLKRDAGIVLAFRRIKSEDPTKTIRLRGLDPNVRYEVTTFGPEPPQAMTGKSLLKEGIAITIGNKAVHPTCPSHTAIKYRRL